MKWPIGNVPGIGPSFVLKGAPEDHAPRPPDAAPIGKEAMRAHMRAYMKARRAQAKAEGKCSVCCTREPKPDCVQCITCAEVNGACRDRRKERRATGAGR